MELLEKVEKIREKTGVSYEEAKAALEVCGEDVLDALVYLENQGKIKKPDVSVYTTEAEPSEEVKEAARKGTRQRRFNRFHSTRRKINYVLKRTGYKGIINMYGKNPMQKGSKLYVLRNDHSRIKETAAFMQGCR